MEDEPIKIAQFYYNNIVYFLNEFKMHIKTIPSIKFESELSKKISLNSPDEIDKCVQELKDILPQINSIKKSNAKFAYKLGKKIIICSKIVKDIIIKCFS